MNIKSKLLVLTRYASTNSSGAKGGVSRGGYPGAMRTSLSRRPVRKIPLGKARPAIYHQFEVAVELSDGSVIMRRSQYPKEEIRLIQDQRNNPLWNPSRDDLIEVDPNAAGSIGKFEQKYGSIFGNAVKEAEENASIRELVDKNKEVTGESGSKQEIAKHSEETEVTSTPEQAAATPSKPKSATAMDDLYLDLLDDSSQQIKTGKLLVKKSVSKKKKK